MNILAEAHSKKGSVFGGVLLLAGSCIGAGMLALPVLTGTGGFIPASALFFIAWLYMTSTALLLLEVNLALGPELSLISLTEKTLGKYGKVSCWALFLFLFYSLGVAYLSASGAIVQGLLKDFFNLSISTHFASLFFTALFGLIVFRGVKAVDFLNRALMGALIFTYCLLIYLGSQSVDLNNLKHIQWSASFTALPVLIISFGFHNMIPSLASYFKGDASRLKKTILLGGLIPLGIYLLWDAILLGIIPAHGQASLQSALDKGSAVTNVLREAAGTSWVSTLGQLFAFFAIVTSFLTQSLSLVDFLSDGLKKAKLNVSKLALVAIAVVPSLLFCFLGTSLFLRALNWAGGFAATLLFGVLPSLMVYKLRKESSSLRLFPGKNLTLGCVLFFSLAIFGYQLFQQIGN